MTPNIERQIIEVIATDRIYKPISSIGGKLERMRPKLARAVDLSDVDGNFSGERVYARVETEDATLKARTMREAVDAFSADYPRYGKILNGLIEETRAAKEKNLYFGVNPGCRLTADDYMTVMTNLGFTEATSRALYPELMNVSRNLARKRQETERSILVG